MFEEANIVNVIKETIKEVIAAAVANKKLHDKKFMLTVVRYQREEEGVLVNILNSFYDIYNSIIEYVSSPECELWFEEEYALIEDNNFTDIKHLLEEYTKTKKCEYSMTNVRDLFNDIKENKLYRTIELLTIVMEYNNFPEECKNIIRTTIDFIGSLNK